MQRANIAQKDDFFKTRLFLQRLLYIVFGRHSREKDIRSVRSQSERAFINQYHHLAFDK